MKYESMEAWILSLLERPIEDLDRDYEDYNITYEEADSLHLAMLERGENVVALPDEIFHALHRRLYGHLCEDLLWAAILCNIGRPLPVSIAHDLLDRELALSSIGHSRQADEVQWRMAAFYSEALLTLAREFYTSADRTFAEFQDLLRQFPDDVWMLTSLSLESASSSEKETYLFHHIRQLPNADEILEPYNHRIQEQQARQTEDQAEIQQLFQTGEAHILLGLAQNPCTTSDILQALMKMKAKPYARGIRGNAKKTLANQRAK